MFDLVCYVYFPCNKVGGYTGIIMFICLCVRPSVHLCVFVHLSICLCVFVYLSICLCVQRISFEVLNLFAATHGMVAIIMDKSVLSKQWVAIFKVKASLRADITKI